MTFQILVVSAAVRVLAGALRITSHGVLLWLALYHAPLLAPSLCGALECEPLAPRALLLLLAAGFAAPEAGAFLLRRRCAATARIEVGVLVVERRGRRFELPLPQIAAVEPWTLPAPWPGLRLRSRAGERSMPQLAADDPSELLAALDAAGAPAGVREALAHPMVRYAHARRRFRGWLDRPLLKYGVFPLVLAIPLFRLHQWISYGGTFGEYHAHGLAAYLLGFALYWLLSAVYLLLFAAALRALAEAIAWLGIGWLPRHDLGVRRTLEILHRALYYLTPPTLVVVHLVLE